MGKTTVWGIVSRERIAADYAALGAKERALLGRFEAQVKAMVVGLGMSRGEAVDAIVDSNHGPVSS